MGMYVMAHRVNDSVKLDMALRYGANALEIDVTLVDGQYKAWHGDPGDWNLAPLQAHLVEVRRALQEPRGDQVALVIIDVKYEGGPGFVLGVQVGKEEIGPAQLNTLRELVDASLVNPINGNAPSARAGLFVLYTMTRAQERDVVEPAITASELGTHEGFNYDAVAYSVDERTSPEQATNWQGANSVRNFMYSTGITATWHSAAARDMAEASMALKAADTAPLPFGTYAWTFNRANNAAHWLRDHDLDGVMGNMRRNFGHLPGHLNYYELGGRELVTRQSTPPFLVRTATSVSRQTRTKSKRGKGKS